MSPPLQTVIALAIVAIAAAALVRRAVLKRRNPGCGGDCGCPANEFKEKLRSRP
jgi:hypothetical protein